MMLSFIIPVYNVEKYLPACIDSIVNQGVKDSQYEVILVDDGSKDASGQICDEYAIKYPNVISLHQENAGVSSARNFGIRCAKGKYIAFVDADDLIEKDSVCRILEWSGETDADVCFMQGVKFYSDGSEILLDKPLNRERIRNKSPEEVLDYLSTQSKYPGSACVKIFQREFINQKNVSFPCDKRHGEDLAFMRCVLLNAESFDFLDGPYYRYRQDRDDSCTHTISEKSFFEYFGFITESIQECGMQQNDKGRYFMSFVAYEYLVSLLMVSAVSKDRKKEAYALLKKYKWVLKQSRVRIVYLTYYLCSLFGLRVTSNILAVYKKKHR